MTKTKMKLVIFILSTLLIGEVSSQYYQVPYYQPYPTRNYLSPAPVSSGYYLVPVYRPGWRCVKCNNIGIQAGDANPEYLPSPGGYVSSPQTSYAPPPPPGPPMMIESHPIEYPIFRHVAPPPSFGVPYSKTKKSIKH